MFITWLQVKPYNTYENVQQNYSPTTHMQYIAAMMPKVYNPEISVVARKDVLQYSFHVNVQ